MAFKPHGIVVPIVTPVTQDGKFNEKAYRDLIEYLANSGIHGVFLGSYLSRHRRPEPNGWLRI